MTKAVILAGGLGTRISEETHSKPKPMIEVGGKPILWHILKIYSKYDINDFIICCGYKGYVIKEYFANYFLHTSDVTFHMDKDNYMEVHQIKSEPWKSYFSRYWGFNTNWRKTKESKSIFRFNPFLFYIWRRSRRYKY